MLRGTANPGSNDRATDLLSRRVKTDWPAPAAMTALWVTQFALTPFIVNESIAARRIASADLAAGAL